MKKKKKKITDSERCRNWRKEHRDNGLCYECGEKPVSGFSLCQKHLERRRFLTQKRCEERRKTGLFCISCAYKPPISGSRFCLRCIEGGRLARSRYRERCKAEGICPDCGNPNDSEMSACKKCMGKRKDRKVIGYVNLDKIGLSHLKQREKMADPKTKGGVA
jgi:hypothetical protein